MLWGVVCTMAGEGGLGVCLSMIPYTLILVCLASSHWPLPAASLPPAPEHERVTALDDYITNPIVVRDLKKIYPGQDGQPPKVGARGGV